MNLTSTQIPVMINGRFTIFRSLLVTRGTRVGTARDKNT